MKKRGRFKFSQEQVENLRSWKSSLNSERAKNWFNGEVQAAVHTSEILNNEDFKMGVDLTPKVLDELFSTMRWFSANRNLSNLLYRNNLIEFNKFLRELIHGTSPFYERVNNFFKLKSIGIQTLSQFLVAANDRDYPFITSQTKDSIGLSSEQDEDALLDAIDLFNIPNRDQLLDRTLDYLRDYIIFKSIKELLELEKYTQVNNLLWFAFSQEEQGPDETIQNYGSVSLEKDLRDFLADRISIVEKGLTLIKKEFEAVGAGEIDLLCKDEDGSHVVVELKKGRTSDQVIGQTLRYMGWIKKNLNSKVRGIIIVNEPDPKLEYALIPINDLIKLKFYKVNFEIKERYSV